MLSDFANFWHKHAKGICNKCILQTTPVATAPCETSNSFDSILMPYQPSSTAVISDNSVKQHQTVIRGRPSESIKATGRWSHTEARAIRSIDNMLHALLQMQQSRAACFDPISSIEYV